MFMVTLHHFGIIYYAAINNLYIWFSLKMKKSNFISHYGFHQGGLAHVHSKQFHSISHIKEI